MLVAHLRGYDPKLVPATAGEQGKGVATMPVVRCPRCGAVNPYGARPLARCQNCREALAKCRYCRHYDARQADCMHPSRAPDERVLDADEMLNCPYFASTLVSGGPSRARPLFRTLGVALLAGLVMAFVLWRLAVGPTPAAAATLKADVTAPTSAFQEEGLEITVNVINQADQPAREVLIRLAGPGMGALECQGVTPAECPVETGARHVLVLLGDLEPGQATAVSFRLAATHTGKQQLTTQVTAANVERPTLVPIECEIMP